MTRTATPLAFDLPASLVADRPPEARGLSRDHVRLLVGDPGGAEEIRFDGLGEILAPGDLVVVNDSETRLAALDATRQGRPVAMHLSAVLDDGTWIVEVRRADQLGPDEGMRWGERIELDGGGHATLIEPMGTTKRLWRASLDLPMSVDRYLQRNAAPIRYPYVVDRWPLSAYTTMFAKPDRRHFGSAEMPSAGRPFTPRLVADLNDRGVKVVAITLHTGVSSLEAHEGPSAERFRVGPRTAAAVNDAKAAGGRVIAVGTTVVRALETAGLPRGLVKPDGGWTNLVLGGERAVNVVDGIITGWHPPDASHLHLLEAVAGPTIVDMMYRTALQSEFLWHEFGDSALMFKDHG